MKRLAALATFLIVSVVATGTHAAECKTAADVANAFENGTDCVVNSCLYGVITGWDPAPTHPYPKGFAKAWLSGYRTIESLLQFKKDIGFRCGLTDQALTMAGFLHPFTGAPYKFHVIDGCALEEKGYVIGIPTVAEWVRELKQKYRIEVPLPVFKKLAEAGKDFKGITGCEDQIDPIRRKPIDAIACVRAKDFPHHDACSCSPEFIDAYAKLHHLSPYNTGQTTETCFKKLQSLTLTEPVVREALWACQDVNPYNAFNGLGFDGVQLTLPEFIVDNVSFQQMPREGVTHLDLPNPCPISPLPLAPSAPEGGRTQTSPGYLRGWGR